MCEACHGVARGSVTASAAHPASASECSGERASFEAWRGEIRGMRATMMVWHMIRDEVVPAADLAR